MERDMHRLIHEMNLAYLLLVQRLLVEDKAVGMHSLGVSSEMADLLVALSLKEIARLASVSQILCSFRFQDHTVLSALTHSQVAAVETARLSASSPTGQFA